MFPRKREPMDLRKTKGHTKWLKTRDLSCLYDLRSSIGNMDFYYFWIPACAGMTSWV